MKLSRAQRNHITSIDSRATIAQATGEWRARQGGLSNDARLLRLSSRYLLHKRAGRVQAAAAVLRMARRLEGEQG